MSEKYKKQLAKKFLDPDKEDEKPIIQVTYLQTVDYVLEQIVLPTTSRKIRAYAGGAGGAGGSFQTRFIKYYLGSDSSTNSWDLVDEEEIEGVIYTPIRSDLLADNNTLIFSSGVDDYESDNKLIKEIRNFVHYYLQVEEEQEWLIVYFILTSWLADQFPFTAYLHFVGVTGSGKSRAVEVLSQLCYKAIQGSGSITVSSIFRLVNQFQGTLILNEFELGKASEEGHNEKLQILKAGSEDYVVFRVEGEGKKKVESFKLKGPKVFAGEHTIDNAALESRMIVIPMQEKTRPLPLYKTNKFKEDGERLRRKLLLWRLKHIDKVNLEDFEFGVEELKEFDSRIQQVMTPLYVLADDEVKEKIIKYIRSKEEDVKAARREEPAGKVFLGIIELLSQSEAKELVWKDVTEKFKEEWTPRKLSNLVRRELGFKIEEKGHNQIKIVILDESLVSRLKNHYGTENFWSSKQRPARPARPAQAQDLQDVQADDLNIQRPARPAKEEEDLPEMTEVPPNL